MPTALRRRRPARSRMLVRHEDFEELYRATATRSLVFFLRRTADPEVARDLWAETWARAYEGRARFLGATRAEKDAWIVGIGRNVLAAYYKRGAVQRRAMARLELERPELDDGQLARLEHDARIVELRSELSRALAGLPAPQREALRLRVVEGMPYPEVARRTEVTESTARARVSRGLRSLSEALGAGLDAFAGGDRA